MGHPSGKMAIMVSLGFLALALAVAAASAADDKIPHRCEVVATKAVVLKGKDVPLYQCASESGARFLLAADSNQDSLETVINAEAIQKLKELSRPKRQYGGFGGGGGFAQSNSQAFSGGFGGGGFPGGFGGGGFGGGGAGASSSANAGGFGGGSGFGGFGG